MAKVFNLNIEQLIHYCEMEMEPQAYANELVKKSKGILQKIGKPNPNFRGREDEVSAVVETLSKKRMRNCVLVGEAGIGKTEIAKKAFSVCDNAVFISLDSAMLQADCTLVGMFEQRVGEIIQPIAKYNKKAEKPISLFIDEIHTLWRLGKNDFVGTVSFGDMLKPYLSDGLISIVGATTRQEYENIIKADKALLRRLPPIFIGCMDNDETFKIIKKFGNRILSDDVCYHIIEKSKEVTYLNNPDCSLEIADRVMAKAIVNGVIPDESEVDAIVRLMKEI